ncbi:MAG: hypothetical protein JWQ44_2247 [Chthoniobacter sp.]|nr:hypothetical protein [Chthoniobacter sp.]
MDSAPEHLHGHPGDHELRSVEELSRYACVSRAFIRLCIMSGCPTSAARLSQAALIEWLGRNYPKVRALAGLRRLASIQGVTPKARQDLQVANTMITMLEYAETRCSQVEEKLRLRAMLQLVERSI